MHLTIDLTWISLTLLAIGTVLIALHGYQRIKHRSIQQTKELWKSLALALEVELECCIDYHTEVYGEGCLTRSRRLRKLADQGANAWEASRRIRGDLLDMKEYDSEWDDHWYEVDEHYWWRNE